MHLQGRGRHGLPDIQGHVMACCKGIVTAGQGAAAVQDGWAGQVPLGPTVCVRRGSLACWLDVMNRRGHELLKRLARVCYVVGKGALPV